MNKLFLLLFISLSCNIKTPERPIEVTTDHPIFDTTTIDLDAINLQAKRRNDRYQAMEIHVLIDSLVNLGSNNGVKEIDDSDKLFGSYKEMGKYYEHNIPMALYEKLFPEEEIILHKERISEVSTNESEKLVTIRKGKEIKEERTYKHLYAVKKKDKYLQLLFTKQGKYNPEITLFTVSKENLELIDQLEIFGGMYDSYDIDYWHSKFSENFDTLSITRVKNLKFDDIELDTCVIQYKFTVHGKIIRQ